MTGANLGSRCPSSHWGQQIASAAAELRQRLSIASVEELGDREARLRDRAATYIDVAERLANKQPKLRHRLREWWSGSRVELCWSYLHAADLEMAGSTDQALFIATALHALNLAKTHALGEAYLVPLENIAQRSIGES